VKLETLPHRLALYAVALTIASAITGCATQPKDPNRMHPVDTTPKHWWESDMDSEDRSFFIGSFFNQDR
jgi:hypothetical protein